MEQFLTKKYQCDFWDFSACFKNVYYLEIWSYRPEYVGDIAARHDEFHTDFVATRQANQDIETLDPKSVLEMDVVDDYIDYRNISVTSTNKHQHKLFTSNHVHYAGK